ncbi:hypothetical protein L204_105078 [Cryptococcus depauperatus]|nr:histone deacetylase HOS3 [Cryptococcus depauperatus CBS 7855]
MSSQNNSPLGLFIQPACLQHKYIRHSNSSHIFERPERLRAVLLGVAAAVARLEQVEEASSARRRSGEEKELSYLLSSLSIASSSQPTGQLYLVSRPPPPEKPGHILLNHPAVQLAHSPPPEAPFPYIGEGSTASAGVLPTSGYLKDLVKWATEAIEKIRKTGCEIPEGLGLNPGDLYLGPGSILAIEGAIQTVCQAMDYVVQTASAGPVDREPSTPPILVPPANTASFTKAFCAIRPPGHHCGEGAPSGFCYVNNVVIGAMHGYLQHDIDRAIIIDFDLHHGNGTQALVMPLNAASYADDLQVKAGKPVMMFGRNGKRRRGWKGFYGSVHDIYSYPCEDGNLDLIRDASVSLAAHGQYIENIHLKPYTSEADFYARIYPLYLAILEKAKVFIEQTEASPESTVVLISAGFDACEHEHQGIQRHERRVPVSFYSRYTKDIVAFADIYTEGKVVSVLEGGYGDRALTSAAMGHIVGMKGELSEEYAQWWTKEELDLLEKIGKRKRGGKLTPLSPDLVSHTHLVRTHSLLAHFDGANVDSVLPSTQSTPATRMTLRDRKKNEDGGGTSTEGTPIFASRRGGKVRGIATATDTPTHKSKLEIESQHTAASPTLAKFEPLGVKTQEQVQEPEQLVVIKRLPSDTQKLGISPEQEPDNTKVEMDDAIKGIANVTLEPATSTESQKTEGILQTFALAQPSQTTLPKIVLRIPARTTPVDLSSNPTFSQIPSLDRPLYLPHSHHFVSDLSEQKPEEDDIDALLGNRN